MSIMRDLKKRSPILFMFHFFTKDSVGTNKCGLSIYFIIISGDYFVFTKSMIEL